MSNNAGKTGVQCKLCGDRLFSWHVHDFKWCSCQKTAVDGGDDYLRVCGSDNELIEYDKELDAERAGKTTKEAS